MLAKKRAHQCEPRPWLWPVLRLNNALVVMGTNALRGRAKQRPRPPTEHSYRRHELVSKRRGLLSRSRPRESASRKRLPGLSFDDLAQARPVAWLCAPRKMLAVSADSPRGIDLSDNQPTA